MAHTNHTTTNQIRQPKATTVRSIETSFVSVPWANARMRETCVKVNKRWDVFVTARRCADFGNHLHLGGRVSASGGCNSRYRDRTSYFVANQFSKDKYRLLVVQFVRPKIVFCSASTLVSERLNLHRNSR
jgi:hypothetical protein